MKKIVIIGLGNPLRSDDGVGLAVIDLLKKEKLPSNIKLVDVGGDELAIIEHLKNADHAIIVDAVSSGKRPGTISIFDSEKIKTLPKKDYDLHTFGLAKAIDLARGLKIKTKITVVGIEPKTVEVSDHLSQEIRDIIPMAVKKITSIQTE